MRTVTAALVFGAVVAPAAGCGGGSGGGNGQPIPSQTQVFESEGAVNGQSAGGTPGAPTIQVGDLDFSVFDPTTMGNFNFPIPVRGFWSFDLSALPAGATV